MAQGKVEICGVNTAKLPILKEEEKEGGNRKKQLLHAQDLCYNIVRYKNDSI